MKPGVFLLTLIYSVSGMPMQSTHLSRHASETDLQQSSDETTEVIPRHYKQDNSHLQYIDYREQPNTNSKRVYEEKSPNGRQKSVLLHQQPVGKAEELSRGHEDSKHTSVVKNEHVKDVLPKNDESTLKKYSSQKSGIRDKSTSSSSETDEDSSSSSSSSETQEDGSSSSSSSSSEQSSSSSSSSSSESKELGSSSSSSSESEQNGSSSSSSSETHEDGSSSSSSSSSSSESDEEDSSSSSETREDGSSSSSSSSSESNEKRLSSSSSSSSETEEKDPSQSSESSSSSDSSSSSESSPSSDSSSSSESSSSSDSSSSSESSSSSDSSSSSKSQERDSKTGVKQPKVQYSTEHKTQRNVNLSEERNQMLKKQDHHETTLRPTTYLDRPDSVVNQRHGKERGTPDLLTQNNRYSLSTSEHNPGQFRTVSLQKHHPSETGNGHVALSNDHLHKQTTPANDDESSESKEQLTNQHIAETRKPSVKKVLNDNNQHHSESIHKELPVLKKHSKDQMPSSNPNPQSDEDNSSFDEADKTETSKHLHQHQATTQEPDYHHDNKHVKEIATNNKAHSEENKKQTNQKLHHVREETSKNHNEEQTDVLKKHVGREKSDESNSEENEKQEIKQSIDGQHRSESSSEEKSKEDTTQKYGKQRHAKFNAKLSSEIPVGQNTDAISGGLSSGAGKEETTKRLGPLFAAKPTSGPRMVSTYSKFSDQMAREMCGEYWHFVAGNPCIVRCDGVGWGLFIRMGGQVRCKRPSNLILAEDGVCRLGTCV